MQEVFDTAARRAIRQALALENYQRDAFALVDPDLTRATWLVSTHRGLYAISGDQARLIAHGWFFGIRQHGDALYLFENCALRNRSAMLGRIVRLDLDRGRICAHRVLAKALHPNCHQLAIIDDALCLLDTANQTIRRYRLTGAPLAPVTPFALAPNTDTSGAYHHINAIAAFGDRTALMLHNGKALPERNSEIVWFDRNWHEEAREALPSRMCHDLVADPDQALWYCASLEGDIAALDGRRRHMVDHYMTRGLAFSDGQIAVGYSAFGPRQTRDGLKGGIILCDSAGTVLNQLTLGGPPAEIIALR